MKTIKKVLFIYTKRFILSTIYSLSRIIGIDNNAVSVICYHGIEEAGNFYSVTTNDFEKQIQKLLKTSRFISADQALMAFEGKKTEGSSIVLTIDDGYASVMDILPLTRKHSIPVLLFVLSNPKNANRKELDHRGKLLSWDQIKYLHSQGVSIGCHSATHANFNKLSRIELEQEIVDSKKILEKRLGFPIKFFAYPKGIYNKSAIELVKKAGYEAAFSVDLGSLSKEFGRFSIPRTVINKTHSLSEFPSLYSSTTHFLRKILNNFDIWKVFISEKV
ncbi:MAG: hypothetical protein A2687_04830 [Candidatus Levybacteria bacterium RIFCSPHIGHO2_01_FULL_38_26]|nr:MAG: hypothetical protein A2687_04830 [Candidatus Levybacteria bacterium RIFCSPHIGHO2_01_FULL_38_26]